MANSRAGLGLVVCWLSLSCGQEAAPAAPFAAAGSAGTASTAGASNAAGAGAGASVGGAGSGSGVGGAAAPFGGMAGAGTAGGGAAGAAGAAGMAGMGGAAPALSDFQLYGRWNVTQPGRAITVNSGSHVTASFSGTGISAKFDLAGNTGAVPTVSFRIDDGELVEKEISSTLSLASGLAPGEHRVLLFARGMSELESRWTPPLVASTTFLGFAVEGGSIVKTARPSRLKVEFLGDSITEGVAVHEKGPDGQTTPTWRCDGARNYAALTGQKLGAEWRQVGFGYQGLTRVGNGGVPKAQDAFDWFYAGVPRDDWQADLVVINQGTNDRGVSGAEFAPLYDQFLGIVRKAYPLAKIAALEPLVGAFGAEIQAQVSARKNAGDAKIFYVDTSGWTSPADFTDGLHPNQAGSVTIADKLSVALQAL